MITFKQYLTEVFDSSYPYKKEEDVTRSNSAGYDFYHAYSFKTPKSKHSHTVSIFHHTSLGKPTGLASIGFHHGDNENYHNTNEEGHSSHKVFSTVMKIMHDHIKYHPEITHIEFKGDDVGKNTTRGSLYKRMVIRHGKDHDTSDVKSETSFKVRVR